MNPIIPPPVSGTECPSLPIRLAEELAWLRQDVDHERLEHLPETEVQAEVMLWALRWRTIALRLGPDPSVYRSVREARRAIIRAIKEYPRKLPFIRALDLTASVDEQDEVARAQETLFQARAHRLRGGWKEDIARAAMELGIRVREKAAEEYKLEPL